MKLTKKQHKMVRWTARVMAIAILLLGLPFYFGYGNPLPFANPENTFFDNMWLMCFPLMFLGLGLGWKYEKAGGWLVVGPITLASVIGFIVLREGLPGPMFIPMIAGICYLVAGYSHSK